MSHPLLSLRSASRLRPPFRALAALLLISAANGCSADTSTSPASAPAPAAVSTDPILPPGVSPIAFASAPCTIAGKPFTLEIADTDPKTERGLMYRPAMAPDHGMLFVFPEPSTAGFWMKNTFIPLDIIFLDKNGKVLVIHHRIPHDETGMGPASPALYVIELNVGTAEKIGLKTGDTIDVKKSLKTASPPTDK
jgi:uncharacterized membrane protein (UPF0127 family)